MARTSRSSSRRSRRGRRGRSLSIASVAKWAGVAAVPIAAAGLGLWTMNTLAGIERADGAFCFARQDQEQVAVLIDNSIRDHSAAQLRDYETGLMRSFDRAGANARISFFTTALDAQGSLARPVFTICKPAQTEAEREAIGAPPQPAPYLRRQAEEARNRFRQAVADVIAATKDDKRRALDSPILELVQAVSKFDGFQGATRSLQILSDGIQNSEVAQFCKEQGHLPRYQQFEASPAYRLIRPVPLTGVRVSILLVEQLTLPNPQMRFCTNEELRVFWPAFFEGNGAASVDLTRLRFGAES